MRLAKWNSWKFLRDARSSNLFRQLAFLATKTVLPKVSRAKRRDFRDRPHTYGGVRSREEILFYFPSLASVSPFTTGMHLVREKCSDVKRRLLRSIFARCTFLNANRACENSRDFIAGAPSFLHGLRIFMRLCKLSHIGIFKDTFLLFK